MEARPQGGFARLTAVENAINSLIDPENVRR
jgi:hypothetical protein